MYKLPLFCFQEPAEPGPAQDDVLPMDAALWALRHDHGGVPRAPQPAQVSLHL